MIKRVLMSRNEISKSTRNTITRNQNPIFIPASELIVPEIEITEIELHKERCAQCLDDSLRSVMTTMA
jgi:hypothetical protein